MSSSLEAGRFDYLRGHTIDDGKIVPISAVVRRNLANQRRIERERLGIKKVQGIIDGKRFSFLRR